MVRPYVVAAFFLDPATQQAFHMVRAIESVSIDAATGRAVAGYYTELGGKLPLVATAALEITRETLAASLAMLEAIDAADKAESEKVVGLRTVEPALAPPEVGSLSSHAFRMDENSPLGLCWCGSPKDSSCHFGFPPGAA